MSNDIIIGNRPSSVTVEQDHFARLFDEFLFENSDDWMKWRMTPGSLLDS